MAGTWAAPCAQASSAPSRATTWSGYEEQGDSLCLGQWTRNRHATPRGDAGCRTSQAPTLRSILSQDLQEHLAWCQPCGEAPLKSPLSLVAFVWRIMGIDVFVD